MKRLGVGLAHIGSSVVLIFPSREAALRESRAGVGPQRDLVRLDAHMLHLRRHLVVVIPVHDRASQGDTRFIQDLGLAFGAM